MTIRRPVISRSALLLLATVGLVEVNAQSVPQPPSSLSASVTGTTVTLLWAPSGVGDPAQAYVVEVGSAPGASNLMRFSTGSPATTLVGTSVAAGTYYVRIRGMNSSGESGASNEIAVTVGSVCGSPPTPPGPLVSSVSGSSVQLSWGGSSGFVSTYVFEIGSFSGGTNLGTMELGSAATTFATSGVAPGTYFVRVKARNPCGLSAPSNDAVVNVGQPTGPIGPARLEIVNLREYTIVGGSNGGERAFAAEVINTGGSTASKVTMNVDVYYPDGRRYYGTFSEVSGRTRRLVSSHELSHSTLAPGESTCISADLTEPSKLGRYTVRLNSETEPTAPALGQLQLKGSWYVNNTFGLVAGAEMTNVGPIRTVDQRAQFMAKDVAGLVVRCGTIPVFGQTRTTFPGFAGTVSQLLPGERGFSATTASYDWENVKSITSITFWPRWRE
jgi:hypothetical protein